MEVDLSFCSRAGLLWQVDPSGKDVDFLPGVRQPPRDLPGRCLHSAAGGVETLDDQGNSHPRAGRFARRSQVLEGGRPIARGYYIAGARTEQTPGSPWIDLDRTVVGIYMHGMAAEASVP